MTKKRVLVGIGCVLGAFVLVGIGLFAGISHNHNGALAETKNPFPLLDTSVNDNSVQQDIINFDPLRQNIKQYLASLNIPHSFYFEYLPNGVNIRDGEDQTTIAASLMKTPIVMDLYSLAEAKKLDLRQTTTIEQDDINNDPEYGNPAGLSPSDLTVGQTITYKQAAYLALHDSNNTAIDIVKRIINPLLTSDTDVVSSLDVAYTNTGSDPSTRVFQISARSYGSIMKCLYYSCFLNPKDSQEVLTDLIGSAGQNELAAGVPSGVQVAHKIGSAQNRQSDCGIVYQPKQPYLVCTMFFPGQQTTAIDTSPYFQKISKMISDYVISKKEN